MAFMNRMRKRAMPVVCELGTLLGYIKYRDVVKAAQAGKGHQPAKARPCPSQEDTASPPNQSPAPSQIQAWMRKELLTIAAGTPFNELERSLLEGSTGRPR